MQDNRPVRIGFLTTIDTNVGDDFIREGVRAILDACQEPYWSFYVNKSSAKSLYEPCDDEPFCLANKYWQADLFIQSGAPMYWHLLNGQSTSVTSEWYDWFWRDCVFSNDDKNSHPSFINLGAGSCQPWGDEGGSFINDQDCVTYAKEIATRSNLTVVRDPVAAIMLRYLGIHYYALPCPAFLAACRHKFERKLSSDIIGLNLMSIGSHYDLTNDFDVSAWQKDCTALVNGLRQVGQIVFICHDEHEVAYVRKFAQKNERVFISTSFRDYFDIYAICSIVIANRVHGAVCAAGFGVPAIIMGNDTRALIGDYINIKQFQSGKLTANEVLAEAVKLLRYRNVVSKKLVKLRNKTLKKYISLIKPIIKAIK